jgi:hypothetical protein
MVGHDNDCIHSKWPRASGIDETTPQQIDSVDEQLASSFE